jgi:hypothetical protein
MYLYYVMVPANVYSGRYYDHRCAPVPVMAQDVSGAQRLVNFHQGEVIKYLAKRKVGSDRNFRYLIPHRDPHNHVFFKPSYYVRERQPGLSWNSEILCPDGKFHRVNYDKTKKTLKINVMIYKDPK